MRPSLAAVILLCLCSCGGRWAPGYLITSEGEMLTLTDENIRAHTVATIVSQLDAQLGRHWRVEAAIAELPVYEQDDRFTNGGWLWPKATTTVTLIGDGQGEPPLDEAQITAAVHDYLYGKVERPTKNLQVTTTRVIDPARFAARPVHKPANKPEVADKPAAGQPGTGGAAPAPAAQTPASRRYVVQTGDTWADLSQAFYGSAQHWRVIADANQGGDLTAGREIVIPPRP